MKTYYWHDYETWGATPAVDRPSQFAGVRTDENLNIVSDPLVMMCKPPVDIWPHPEAILVTGILPQEAWKQGVSEREFIKRIHAELSQPGTCGVGYNSLRFDDEVTRYTLYRNYFDPYEREWRNGNSRWDIIDMVRLVYALRPEGIEWPIVKDQIAKDQSQDRVSFKLELLTQANGITHANAHDAYSDVEATIALAKLVKEKKPALYDYVVKHRGKHDAAKFIDIAACKPLLHISSKFPSSRGCAGLIAPLAMHPVNKNAVIVMELSADPSPLEKLSPEEIRARVFTSQDDLPEGEERLPIKLVHLNKCPILATPKLLDEAAAKRLGIDKTQCEANWQKLRQMNVGAKLQAMYKLDDFESPSDPEQRLYDGFIGDSDKKLMTEVRRMKGADFCARNVVFDDDRLNGMLLAYKARNFDDALDASEQAQWNEWVADRLINGGERLLSYDAFQQRIRELSEELCEDARKSALLKGLSEYASNHFGKYVKDKQERKTASL